MLYIFDEAKASKRLGLRRFREFPNALPDRSAVSLGRGDRGACPRNRYDGRKRIGAYRWKQTSGGLLLFANIKGRLTRERAGAALIAGGVRRDRNLGVVR